MRAEAGPAAKPQDGLGLDLVLLIVVQTVWGINWIFSKLALAEIPPLTLITLRFIIIFLMFLPWLRWHPGRMHSIGLVSLTAGALSFGLGFMALTMAHDIAPLALAGLGLLHDQLAGGPYGLFVALYLSAYLVGRVAAVVMSAPNLVSLWGGFFVTALTTVAIAWFVAPLGLGRNVSVLPYTEAVIVTAILFPLVRPLYMSAAPSMRPQPGARR